MAPGREIKQGHDGTAPVARDGGVSEWRGDPPNAADCRASCWATRMTAAPPGCGKVHQVPRGVRGRNWPPRAGRANQAHPSAHKWPRGHGILLQDRAGVECRPRDQDEQVAKQKQTRRDERLPPQPPQRHVPATRSQMRCTHRPFSSPPFPVRPAWTQASCREETLLPPNRCVHGSRVSYLTSSPKTQWLRGRGPGLRTGVGFIELPVRQDRPPEPGPCPAHPPGLPSPS